MGLFLAGLLISVIHWMTQPGEGWTQQRSKFHPVRSAMSQENPQNSPAPKIALENFTRGNVESDPTWALKPENPYPINPELLWQNLEAVAGERYQTGDRRDIQDYLVNQLEQLNFSPELQTFDQGVNIVARQQKNPDQGVILVAAHYDTVLHAPGVDDNGSGVAVILEVARLFGDQQTPLTLEIAFFDQEEQGLLGSLAFTSQAENLENLRAVVVLDMVGYACHEANCQQYPAGIDPGAFLQASGVKHPDRGEF